MIRTSLIAAALAATTLSPAFASECEFAPRSEVIEYLDRDWGERIIGGGVNDSGNIMVEVLVNKATGTWSVVITGTHLRSCIHLNGDGWTPGPLKGDPA